MKNNWLIKKSGRKAAALALAAIMALSLAGCGGKDGEQAGSPKADSVEQGTGGYVYVPEYIELGGSEDDSSFVNNLTVQGNYVYYSISKYDEATETSTQTIFRRELGKDSDPEALPVTIDKKINLERMIASEDDSIVCVLADYSSQMTSEGEFAAPSYYLAKYDAQGQELFRQDLTELLAGDPEESYIQYFAVDTEGRMYASTNNKILLFDKDGVAQGEIPLNNWIQSLTANGDKAYVTQYDEAGNGLQLKEIDFAAKTMGQSYNSVPNGNGSGGMSPAGENGFLVLDNAKLYRYDMASQTSEELLSWLDSDINGQYVDAASMLEDGRVSAVIRDWDTGKTELALLTRTEASKVAQRQVITIGTLYDNQSLQRAAVDFNKRNEQYRIKIKCYIDNNAEWSENTYTDAIALLNNDITSGGGPDLFNITEGLDWTSLTEKGALEDLTPYLDASAKLKREDFLEAVLDAFVVDEKLVGIPSGFSIQTVAAKTSLVGDKMGWTLDELMALADQHPDTDIFDFATKNSILNYCINFNQDSFINRDTGEVSFDSDGFRKVLEFANRFPAEFSDNQEEKSIVRRLRDGDVMLYTTSVYDVANFVVTQEMFGEDEPVTFIGYPTVDGGTGAVLSPSEAYAISSNSSNKEGAWAFVEDYLSNVQEDDIFRNGLPSRRDMLDKLYEDAMKIEYVTDENGETVLDENGEPMKQSRGSYGWGNDDLTINYYGATQEDIDALEALIKEAKPAAVYDQQIMTMVMEEAEPYFAGQKSVDDVVGLIQSRVQLYISENS